MLALAMAAGMWSLPSFNPLPETFTPPRVRKARVYVAFLADRVEPERWITGFMAETADALSSTSVEVLGWGYFAEQRSTAASSAFLNAEIAPDYILWLRPVPSGIWGRLWGTVPSSFTFELTTCPGDLLLAYGRFPRRRVGTLAARIAAPPVESPPRDSPWFDSGVAVLPLANSTNSLLGVDRLRALVRDNIARKGYQVMELDNLDARLRTLGITDGGQIRAADVDRIREVLGARHLVYGSIEEYRAMYFGSNRGWQVQYRLRWEYAGASGRSWHWEHVSDVSTKVASSPGGYSGLADCLTVGIVTALTKASRTYVTEESIQAVDMVLTSLPARPVRADDGIVPGTRYTWGDIGGGYTQPVGIVHRSPHSKVRALAGATAQYRPGFGFHVLGGWQRAGHLMHEVGVGFRLNPFSDAGNRAAGYVKKNGSPGALEEQTWALTYRIGYPLRSGDPVVSPFVALQVDAGRTKTIADEVERKPDPDYIRLPGDPPRYIYTDTSRNLETRYGLESIGVAGLDLRLFERQNGMLRFRVTYGYPLFGAGFTGPRVTRLDGAFRFDFVRL